MWIDGQGVCHTAALPDPTVLMSVKFRTSLDLLIVKAKSELLALIEDEESRFYARLADASSYKESEVDFEGMIPPIVLRSPVVTVDDVKLLIRRTSVRWTLDTLLALADYID